MRKMCKGHLGVSDVHHMLANNKVVMQSFSGNIDTGSMPLLRMSNCKLELQRGIIHPGMAQVFS